VHSGWPAWVQLGTLPPVSDCIRVPRASRPLEVSFGSRSPSVLPSHGLLRAATDRDSSVTLGLSLSHGESARARARAAGPPGRRRPGAQSIVQFPGPAAVVARTRARPCQPQAGSGTTMMIGRGRLGQWLSGLSRLRVELGLGTLGFAPGRRPPRPLLRRRPWHPGHSRAGPQTGRAAPPAWPGPDPGMARPHH
jgi:hypothetical protein